MCPVNSVLKGKPYFLVAGTETAFGNDLGGLVEDVQVAIAHYIHDKVYPTNPVVFVGMPRMKDLLELAMDTAKKSVGSFPTVSLSDFYCGFEDFFIHVNRLVDLQGEKVGVGPRPGFSDLRSQVREVVTRVKASFGQSEVMVVDDTLFNGSSVLELLRLGLKIRAIVVVFATNKARGFFENEKDIRVFAGQEGDILDMMSVHDFLPPLPLCGRVVGSGLPPTPILIGGVSLSFPYLLPWISSSQLEPWAGIPAQHSVDFSGICIRKSIEVFEVLEGKGIRKVEDLLKFSFRASRPVPLEGETFHLGEDILDILWRRFHQLNKGR